MKQVFIVNGESGSLVISRSSLAEDIRELQGENKFHQKNIDAMVNGILKENTGTAMSEANYTTLINNAIKVIAEFESLDPYTYGKKISNLSIRLCS